MHLCVTEVEVVVIMEGSKFISGRVTFSFQIVFFLNIWPNIYIYIDLFLLFVRWHVGS